MDGIPRNDPTFSAPFAKDPADEELLATLNKALAPVEEAGYLDLEEEYPTLHIVGVPRSGTTLLYQVVAAGLEIGYVSNLVAAFWRAPVLGLRLARKLGMDRFDSSFDSSFGRTRGAGEPHEFGYFWNHHLRYPGLDALPDGHEETIDWRRLRTVLVNMAHWSRGPIAFKPMLLTWHLERMAREMPRTCYVWIRRDLHTAALSLLEMRKGLFGSYESWVSLRPNGPEWLEGEPPWRQVAAQVVVLDRSIEAALARLGDSVLRVEYEELCAEPVAVLEQVRALLAAKGFEPRLRATGLGSFEPRRRDTLEAEFGGRVDEALEHYTSVAAAPL
ncbi:MAG TPA: sulfotransferase [Gaiellaceae bacterium]|nr:sulfotransferase [Gaiellaceae bacterium]